MKNNSGQVIVIFLILIPPVLILLFSVANITLAVRDRLKLQNSADAAVLSGAEWQAKGLNQMAVANAAIEAVGLLKQVVENKSEGQKKKEARLLMLDFEKRQLQNIKEDIKKRIPGFVEKSARQNGEKTLLGENYTKDDGRLGRDFGAEAFGINGRWHYLFEKNEKFYNTINRILGVAWRKPTKSGALNNIFGSMRLRSGYAFASSFVKSESYNLTKKIIVPDFTAKLFKVIFTDQSFSFLKDKLGLYFIQESRDEINEEILH